MNGQTDIVCVASTPNRAVARTWRAVLEAEGIECQVGESLTTWLSSRPGTQMDLWVESIHLERSVDMHLWVESSGFLGGNAEAIVSLLPPAPSDQ